MLIALLDGGAHGPGSVAGVGQGQVPDPELVQGPEYGETAAEAVSALHSNQRGYPTVFVSLYDLCKKKE